MPSQPRHVLSSLVLLPAPLRPAPPRTDSPAQQQVRGVGMQGGGRGLEGRYTSLTHIPAEGLNNLSPVLSSPLRLQTFQRHQVLKNQT
ncbi:hypothetical protein E2C01_052824 [Portunus trituberculatus]|uniref:Uncharacterized protein n=1 Tax=Portunus trituberculatus TaxID=210409 RepID=A0A5B7GMW3_PORTR|nr:hypothetical protein [Portunus trituberculatus]